MGLVITSGVLILAVLSCLQTAKSFRLDAGNLTENVTSPANNITAQLSQETNVSVHNSPDNRRRIKELIPSRLLAKRSSMGRTPRDRARFIVGALNRRNCLQRILCGLGTKPQPKSGLINDYMYLMDDLIEDDDVRVGNQARRPYFRPDDDYPMPSDDEELMNDPDFLEFVQMERQKEAWKRPSKYRRSHSTNSTGRMFGNHFFPPPFPPRHGPPMNKNQFISKRRVELKNEKDLRKRLGLAVDAGRTLGSRQQCRYLFDECPINDQQVDALVRGLRKLLKNDSMKATTPAPTAAAKEKAKADVTPQPAGAPASKVEIVLNLNQNGLPYGGLYPGSPLNISYPQQPAPVQYVEQIPSQAPVTTAKPSEEDQLMSFLDGMLNLNPTTEMPLDWLMSSNVIKDMDKLLEEHEQESLGDYLENPLKVVGTSTKPEKKPIVRAPQSAKERESSEESSEAGDILDNVLASMKETLMNLADRNNLTIASDLLPPRSSEEESKEEEEDDLPRESEEEDYNPTAQDKDSEEDTEVLLKVSPKKHKETPQSDEPEEEFDEEITPEEILIAGQALKKLKEKKKKPIDDEDEVNDDVGKESGEDDEEEQDDEVKPKKPSKPQKITIIFAPSGKVATNSSTIAITPDEKTNIATLTKALIPSVPPPPPPKRKKPLATTQKPVARTPPPYFREFEKISELVKDTKIVNMSDFDENSPVHPAIRPTKIRITTTKKKPHEQSWEIASSEEEFSEETRHSSEEDKERSGVKSEHSKTLVAVPYLGSEETFGSFEDHNSNWNYFLGNFYTNVMGIRQADDPMDNLPPIGLFHPSESQESGEVKHDNSTTKTDLEESSIEEYDDGSQEPEDKHSLENDKQSNEVNDQLPEMVEQSQEKDRQDFQFDDITASFAPGKKKPFNAPKLFSSTTPSSSKYRVTRRPKPPRLERYPARPIIVNGNFDGQSENVQSLYYKPLSRVKPKIRVDGNIGQPIELFTTSTEKSKTTTTAKSSGPKPKRRLKYKTASRKVKKKEHLLSQEPFSPERERGLPIIRGLLPQRENYPLSTFFNMFSIQRQSSEEGDNPPPENSTRKTKMKRKRPEQPERMPPPEMYPPPTGLSGLKNFNWRNLLSKYGNSLYDKAMASYTAKEKGF